MSNGIAISQEGIPVDDALDAQKVLDSRWRFYEILFEEKISVGTLSQPSTYNLFEHKLNFLPAFDCYNLTLDSYMDTGNAASSGNGLLSDETKVYFTGSYNDPGWSNTEVLLRIYNVPIMEEYEAPIEKTSLSRGTTPSRQGVQINTGHGSFTRQELIDYTLSTKGKNLGIHKTGTAVAEAPLFSAKIWHYLGFPPSYLAAFASDDKKQVGAINPSLVPAKSLSTENDQALEFQGSQAVLEATVAYIIFKEPLELIV